MSKKNKIQSKIIGLDAGLAFGKFFLNTEDLHFGYWKNNEKPTSQNFSDAQQNHSQLIIDHIPSNTTNILDVGSGSGNLALKLLSKGYNVDCVIPSTYLAQAVEKKIEKKGTIHICTFEELKIKKKYDTIIFSESFQYINIAIGLKKIQDLLKPSGHLIICDFFQKDISQKSPMGGGHPWPAFQKEIKNSQLTNIKDKDITIETAPSVEFLNNFCQEVLKPISNMIKLYMLSNYPTITKLIIWRFKKRFVKINKRYLSGIVNGDCFKKFKTYRLLIYKVKH